MVFPNKPLFVGAASRLPLFTVKDPNQGVDSFEKDTTSVVETEEMVSMHWCTVTVTCFVCIPDRNNKHEPRIDK